MFAGLFIIPNATFIVEFIAFVVLVVVIAKAFLPYLDSAITKRQETISNSLASAREAEQKALDLLEERKQQLEQARQKAREIIEQANRLAEDIKKDSQEKADAQYKEMLKRAEADIELLKQNITRELEESFGSLVVLAAEKVLGQAIDLEKHNNLIRQTLSDQSLWGATKV